MARQARGLLEIEAISPPLAGERGADRMAIFGRSGSGKSYLARSLLAIYGAGERYPVAYRGFLVIIDPNGNFEWPGAREVDTPEEVEPSKRHPVVLYRPSPEMQESPEAWNEVFRRLFLLDAPLMVYIDELTAVEPLFGVRRIGGGNYLGFYLTRGRALGKGLIAVTQSPSSIPLNIIRQSEYFVAFDLPFPEDRERITGVMGRYTTEVRNGEVVEVDLRDRNALGRYEFWFYGPSTRQPVRMIVT